MLYAFFLLDIISILHVSLCLFSLALCFYFIIKFCKNNIQPIIDDSEREQEEDDAKHEKRRKFEFLCCYHAKSLFALFRYSSLFFAFSLPFISQFNLIC